MATFIDFRFFVVNEFNYQAINNKSFCMKIQIAYKHPFHLVNRSQLPFLGSIYAMLFTMSIVYFLHASPYSINIRWNNFVFHASAIGLTFVTLSWFLMIVFESGKGYHTLPVQKGLKIGFWLFLISEAMLFFSFFWAFFHFKLNPSAAIGVSWKPFGTQIIDPFKIPLLNTIILLSSGFTATIAHRAILNVDFIWNPFRKTRFLNYLLCTIVLGYIFLICQGIEYSYGINQNWMSNVVWSIFFLLTGFHGAHVIVGTLFLQFNFVRTWLSRVILLPTALQEFLLTIKLNPIPKNGKICVDLGRYGLATIQHLGLETALYYWHFVDAVWILLYMVVYLS